MPAYLTLRQAATYVGVSESALSGAMKQGILVPSKTESSGSPGFTVEELNAYSRHRSSRDGQSVESAALQRAILLLTSELRPDQVLQRLAEEARRLVGARYAALGVMDENGRIHQFITTGVTQQQRKAIGNLPAGHGLLGALFREGASLRLQDISKDHRSVGFPPNHPQMKSFLGVPIISQGKNIGNIYLADKEAGTDFTDADQHLIEVLVQYAAVAIQNAKLYGRATTLGEQWQSLSSIAHRVASSLKVKGVLGEVVRSARRLLQADAAFMALLDDRNNTLRITASSGIKTPAMRNLVYPSNQGLGGTALGSKQPVATTDYASDPRIRSQLVEVTEEGIISEIAVPLEARGQQLGVLYIGSRSRRIFTEDEINLATEIGALAAVAVDNARLFNAERVARLSAASAQTRLETALEHLPEAAYLVDRQRRVILANGTASQVLLGKGKGRLEGNRHPFGLKLYHADGSPMDNADTPVSLCLRGQGPCLGVEIIAERRDGSRVPLLVNAAPVLDETGMIAGVVVVQQDISRLKEVEQMKDDFLSMITHDLKSPLTAIKVLTSSLDIQQNTDALTVPNEYVRAIEQEVDHLTELVNNLLDMSRLEARSMPLDLEECYLIDLVAECVGRFAHSPEGVSNPVVLDIAEDLPALYADYNQIQRVVSNLLSNAGKYSERGAEIYVRAGLPEDKHVVEVQVEDRGIGIPTTDLQRVFEKFYRSPYSRGGRRQGSGLGLAICRAILQAHGCNIFVASQPGKGSVFSFTLPLAQ